NITGVLFARATGDAIVAATANDVISFFIFISMMVSSNLQHSVMFRFCAIRTQKVLAIGHI
ncbi:hypothetical protein OFO99_24745, partial [Escherichia coli]|nr:hypothetical protein [Escherichia coli]